MTVYLAAPYQCMYYMRHLRTRLQKLGYVVTSRWLEEDPENHGISSLYAERDIADIVNSDTVIVYNPAAYERSGTGGRHVELGIAIATKKLVIIFGRPTNVFHLAPGVRIATHMEAVIEILKESEAPCSYPSSSAA